MPTPSHRGSASRDGSGRTSRASGMMMSLLGMRNRRERSNSDSSSTPHVPVVDDVFLKPSVPSYIRNNTGWENMPAPPCDTQIYLLQPQQSLSTTPPVDSKENNPTFMGQAHVSTPPIPSQAQFVPSYYTYTLPNIYQWPHAGVSSPMMPMSMPVHSVVPPSGSTAASQSFTSQTSKRSGRTKRRPRSPLHSRRQSRDRSYDSSQTETRYRSRRSSTPSRSHCRRSSLKRSQRYRRTSSRHKKVLAHHFCTGCGRIRSRKFHDSNPFRPGKKTLINYCLKCREVLDLCNDDRIVSAGETEPLVRVKVQRHTIPVFTTSLRPMMEEAIQSLPKPYAAHIANSSSSPKESRHEHSHTQEPRTEPVSVKTAPSKESTKVPTKQPLKTASNSSLKKTRGYHPPTVESVLDSDDEEPSSYYQCSAARPRYSKSEHEYLRADDCQTVKSSPSVPPPRSEVLETTPRGSDRLAGDGNPSQHHVRFETLSRSETETKDLFTGSRITDNKTNFFASFPPACRPAVIASPPIKSVRRCASDHVNFEQYRKRRTMAMENQEPHLMCTPHSHRCYDHIDSEADRSVFYCQTMPSALTGRKTRDAFSSPLKPASHDMYGATPYSPLMPIPGSTRVPRTFSVHTVSPSMASEELYQPQTSQPQRSIPKSPAPFEDDAPYGSCSNAGQDGWSTGYVGAEPSAGNWNLKNAHRAMSDATEELPSPRSSTLGVNYDDQNGDPISQLGEGIPPYNFDLFSEVGSRRSFQGNDDGCETETANPFSDEAEEDDQFDDTCAAEFHYNSFENDPIVPDYNFDLFSDVTNCWSPPNAGYGEANESRHDRGWGSKTGDFCEKENETAPNINQEIALVGRSRPLRRARKPSTFEVEEYTGTDDDAASVASSSLGKPGTRSFVSTTQRLVDCEVISNPDDSHGAEARRTRPPLRCRASIRTIQTVY
ncbi:hypothetical protein SPBR_06518 [Sporothrix brasiliensis 5110]|uniref:Uncharacterized protein n=1 Tax=Sporothrix brasiliensis 5110 TaxID=1398154 RepID=A0A0C2ETA4_9PEZI|nr:uncharacterized protein SPBR_06518 [Sporothrix brasiliensis 5110]KIH89664.1 hypothetical protein SPBR_06518 [Sporothrix brasiliensis 5110]